MLLARELISLRMGLDGDYWRGLFAGGLPTMTLTRIAIAPFAGR
jgi:hypothetical protein